MFCIVECSILICYDNKESENEGPSFKHNSFYQKEDMEVRFAVISSLYKVFLNVHTHLLVHTACMCMMCFQLSYTRLLPWSL